MYFKTDGFSEVKYSAGGAEIPTASSSDWIFEAAATSGTHAGSHLPKTTTVDIRTDGSVRALLVRRAHCHCADTLLRGGRPGAHSTLSVAHPIIGQGHSISEISLTYRYVSGYDASQTNWPVLSVELVDADTGATTGGVLYTSAPDLVFCMRCRSRDVLCCACGLTG